MTQFLDLDTVELRARACLESGSGTIDPQTVLELVRLLRAANAETGKRAIVYAPDTGDVGGFPRKFAANVGSLLHPEAKPLGLAFAEEPPPCSCDQSQALEARIAEIEARTKQAAPGQLGCFDCGRKYSLGPDLVVSNEAFARIAPHPPEGGVLCPNCMHDRFAALQGDQHAAGGIVARFTSGPFAETEDQRATHLLGAFARANPGWTYRPLWHQNGTSGPLFCCELQGPEESDGEHEGRGATEAAALLDALKKARGE